MLNPTYASERPLRTQVYDQYNVSFSPHTLDNSRHIITRPPSLGLSHSSICVKIRSEDVVPLSITPVTWHLASPIVLHLAYHLADMQTSDQPHSLRRPDR